MLAATEAKGAARAAKASPWSTAPVGWALATIAMACAGERAIATAAQADAATAASCAPLTLKADGTCCPVGQFYDSAAVGCRSAGPPGCGLGLATEASSCQLRWCYAWRTVADQPCSSPASLLCWPKAEPCPVADSEPALACPVGQWPGGAAGSCVAAGGAAGGSEPKSAPPAVATAADLVFCRDPLTASLVPCTSGTPVCPAGQVPAAAPATGCVPLGVPWHCPPGFEVDSTQAAVAPAPPPCKPDATVCGQDEYGGVAPAPNVVFVDGNAPAGGNGKRKTPFDNLPQALAAVPVGGIVAVAAGTYTGNLTLNKAMTLRGRCAALVRIDGGKGQVTLRFEQPAGSVVQVMGLQVTGARGGLFAQSAGETVATGLYVHSTRFMAVAGLAVGGKLLLQDSVVGPNASDCEPAAIGVSFEHGFTAHLQRVRIGGARGNGLIARDPKTVVTARELLIDSTAVADSSLTQGNGIQVQDGASLSLTSCRLAANRSAGLSTFGAATQVEARGLLIDGTLARKDSGDFGFGLDLAGGSVRLIGAALYRNRDTGVRCEGPTVDLSAEGLVIAETQPRLGDGKSGLGLGALNGAQVRLAGARLTGNRALAMLVRDPKTLVAARHVLVDHTLPRQLDGAVGQGIAVYLQAKVVLAGVRLHANHEAALVSSDYAQVHAVGLLIDGTLPAADTLQIGIGANAISGGQLNLAGARLTNNRTAGLSVVDVDSQAHAFGVRIDGTRAAIGSKGNEFGTGAIAYKAALLDLQGCRIDDNQAVGVYVADGPVLVRNSLILNGIPGKFPRTDATGRILVGDVALADGVVLARSAPAFFDRVVVAGHTRACILADAGQLELLATAATGCHFGVATQFGAQLVQKSVLLHGNTVNFSADGGLAVPTAPQVAVAGTGD